MKKNPYEMQIILGIKETRTYLDFENSKRNVNTEKLVKLWRVSGLSAKKFMEMIEEEMEK